MSGETRPYTIPVTVEWALWGKERSDLEYRLLRYSGGTLSSANFDELLTRYATGTLETLPQVTISWFEDEDHEHHIALSIHEAPADCRVDATGRPVVLTRCFCVPYAILAEGHVSYQAMYDEFRKIPLHEREGAFETALPVMPTASYAGLSAQRAAALLVTCRPVCILEADRVGLTERLGFIDSVMSLLPYGLRCQLSASTWASSQFWEHKFRLFFSSDLRPDDEYDVRWGGDARPVAYPAAAAEYWEWLEGGAPDLGDQLGKRAAQLTGKTAPVRFRGAEVDNLLDGLYGLPAGSRRRARSPAPVLPEAPADERTERTIEELLADCADSMRGNDQFFVRTTIIRLAKRRDDKVTPEDQERYRKIIKEGRLLGEDRPLDRSLRSELYAALLEIAFELPLTYEGYCQLEDCAGLAPGQPMRAPLLRAASQAGISDLCVKLLVASADGARFRATSRDHVSLVGLIEVVADPGLKPGHGRVIFDAVFNEIVTRARSQRLDEERLRSALARQAYLAPVLHRVYSEPDERLSRLRTLLRLAYGETLGTSDIRAILWEIDRSPTNDLFFAVVAMSDPGNAAFAERIFIRKLTRRYNTDTTSGFLAVFPDYSQRGGEDRPPPATRSDARAAGGQRRRVVSPGQLRQTGSHVLQRLPSIQVTTPRRGTDRAAARPGLGQAGNWVRLVFVLGALVIGVIVVALLIQDHVR